MDIPHFISSSVEGHLGCFQFLTIVHHAAMSFHIQSSVGICFHFLGVYVGVKLLGHKVRLYSSSRNYKTIFQSCYSILHLYQLIMKVPVSSSPYQYLEWPIFFIIKIAYEVDFGEVRITGPFGVSEALGSIEQCSQLIGQTWLCD